jgi:parallel beta-helix repeat protein
MKPAKTLTATLIIAITLSMIPITNVAVGAESVSQTLTSSGTIIANQVISTFSSSAEPAQVNTPIKLSGKVTLQPNSTTIVSIQISKDQQSWTQLASATPNSEGTFETTVSISASGNYLIKAICNNQEFTISQVVADRIVDINGQGYSTNIQAAINSLSDSGGLVYVKSGLYDLNGQTLIVKSRLTLVGSGIGKTIIQLYPAKHTANMSIEYAVASNSKIEGLTLQDFTVVQNVVPVNHHGAIFLGSTNTDVTIRNVKVTDASGGGIAIHSYNNVLVENCIVQRTWTGIVVGTNGSNAVIRGNTITDTTGDGIYPEDASRNVLIENNYLQNIGDTAIDVSCPTPGTHVNTIVRNNTVQDGSIRVSNAYNVLVIGNYVGGKISVDAGQGYPHNVSVIDNKIVSSYEVGIAFLGAFDSIAEDNVVIMTKPDANVTQSGVYAAFWHSGIIQNNTITNPANYGISFQNYALGSGNNITITGNSIQNYGTYGLWDDNRHSETIYVTNNTFTSVNGTRTIYVQCSDNHWVITGNITS